MSHPRRHRLVHTLMALIVVVGALLPAAVAAGRDANQNGSPEVFGRDPSLAETARMDADVHGLRAGLESSESDAVTTSTIRIETAAAADRSGASQQNPVTRTPTPTVDRTPSPAPTRPPVARTAPPTPTVGRTTLSLSPTPPPASSTAPPTPTGRIWGVIGNDGKHLATERAAGLNVRLFELAWSSYEPSRGTFRSSYVLEKRRELASMRAAGFKVILSLGIHHDPAWLLAEHADSAYVNQFGDVYDDPREGAGRANLIWNKDLRKLAATYINRVLADFGTNFYAVRLGGGRFGELGYPVARWAGRTNTYWAFDRVAARTNPVPGWTPGSPSPNGEAARFANWYMNQLVDFQTWQVATVRRSYAGRIMMLYPSWGIRPAQLSLAIARNLDGSSPAERNGEVPRGYDFARQIAALPDMKILPTTTWLDASSAGDADSDRRYWSPVHYLSSLSKRDTFGENTGQGTRAAMNRSAAQVKRYGLVGMLWYREDELLSGRYATLANYGAAIIAADR